MKSLLTKIKTGKMNCSLPTFRSKNHDRFPRFVDLIKSYLTPMISGLFRKRFSLANLLWRLFFFFLWLKQKVTSPVSIQWFIGSLNNIWLINNIKRQWLQKWIACIFVSVQNCWDKHIFLKLVSISLNALVLTLNTRVLGDQLALIQPHLVLWKLVW